MQPPDDRRYHAEHTWVQPDDGRLRVGITDYAQEQLSSIVYVDLPEAGTKVEAGQAFGEIESTKTLSDLIAPISGTVVERNDAVSDDPEVVNRDPYGDGWLIVIDPADDQQLKALVAVEDYREMTP